MLDNISNEQMDEIIELIYSGQKVAACKRIMEIRQKELDERPSLYEVKKFVETLTAELKSQHPDRFTTTKAGCMSVVIFFLSAFTAAFGLLIILVN
jgi:hypothetical protein